MEQTIEDSFPRGYDGEEEEIRTSFRNMMEWALIDIVEQGFLHAILIGPLDELAKWTRFMDALKQRAVRNSSILRQSKQFLGSTLTE